MGKKLFFILIALLPFCISVAQIPSNGLLAYYPFCGNAYDLSGHGHNLTVVNATLTTDRFGNPNNAYLFGGINCYLYNDTVFNLASGSSISAWILPTSVQDGQAVYNGNSNSNGVGLVYDAGAAIPGTNATMLAGNVCFCISQPATLNQWHHIVLTNDPSNHHNLYVDGVLVGNATATTLAPTGKFGIGNDYTNNTNQFQGTIDDVAIYNRVLTYAEIQQLYTATTGDTVFASMDTSICSAYTPLTLSATPGNSYLWSNGSTTQTISVNNSGNYWNISLNTCVNSIDTFHVTVIPFDTITSVTDTTVCLANGPIMLTATAGNPPYLWSNGSTSQSISVTNSGTYWVTSHNNCEILVDTFHVATPISDTILRSIDTNVCGLAGSALLIAASGSAPYLWNNGSTNQSILVSSNGTYWVTSHTACGINVDTFHVTFSVPDTLHILSDTTVCAANVPITLSSPSGVAPYLWSTGNTTSSIQTYTPGTYWVEYENGCDIIFDTISLKLRNSSFRVDTTACQPILFQMPDSNASYLWQNGLTSQGITVAASVVLTVTVTDNGCAATDTLAATIIDLKQNFNDTTVCTNELIRIPLNVHVPPATTISWNTGSHYNSIIVSDTGKYWVYLKDSTCTSSDTVYFYGEDCNCFCKVPSAFTPNNDGKDDVLKPIINTNCNVSGYSFSIFNRWGELIFKSASPSIGWDGKFKGTLQNVGVYMYELKYTGGPFNKSIFLKGDITLVR